jgi:hypothetical protein
MNSGDTIHIFSVWVAKKLVVCPQIAMARKTTPDATKGEVAFGALAKAKDAVSGAVKDILVRFVKDRQTATAQYESTLMFIGEFAGALSAPETSK